MSVNGFKVNGNVERYDYRYLDNTPDFEGEIAKSALYSENIFDISLFENGAINVSNGSNVNSTSRIRLKGFLPWTVTEIGSTTSEEGFLLYAWDKNGNYVGGWKNGAFGNDVGGVDSLDMTTFYRNPAFSGYKYKIVIYTAQIDTISGVYLNNLSIENLFKRGPILSHDNVTILPNGTDFDTLTTAGNYLVENYSQISTHINTPPGVAAGGRLLVYYGIGRSRPVQIWISFDSNDEPEIWIRLKTSTWGKWYKIGGTLPVNLRVLGYNIGEFNWGRDGGLSENVDDKIANYKKFFGSVNPDIMLFAEMATNIDSSGTYPSDSTLLAPLFVKRANFHENAADTNLANAKTLESDGGVYLRNNNNEYAGAVGRLVCDICNKKLIMSGGFLRVLSTAQDRLEAFQNYLAAIASYDYSVIYLDTNVQDDTERRNIYNAAVSAGYQVCNGGYFGLMETLVPTSMYKPIDNIFVKGNIKIKNFFVASSEYENLSSDHIPVIADLTLY